MVNGIVYLGDIFSADVAIWPMWSMWYFVDHIDSADVADVVDVVDVVFRRTRHFSAAQIDSQYDARRRSGNRFPLCDE